MDKLSAHTRPAREIAADGRPQPTLLLSASVPYRRKAAASLTAGELQAFEDLNESYLRDAHPARIRSAVIELTRAALGAGLRLVFGAHPAISPMVLVAARDAGAAAGSVLIYQSRYFEHLIPQSTYELADWRSGWLVKTDIVDGPTDIDRRNVSLTLMREAMVTVPGLCGAVFIGGMDGLEEEAGLLDMLRPEVPKYALASTSSAARILWEQYPKQFGGTLAKPEVLVDSLSYSVVARLILEDLSGLASLARSDI